MNNTSDARAQATVRLQALKREETAILRAFPALRAKYRLLKREIPGNVTRKNATRAR